MVIFVICLSSFAVALTLGGGPRATTIELAIYQAVRFGFDFATAAMMGLVQLGLSVIATLLAVFLGMRDGLGLDRLVSRLSRHLVERLRDGAIISLAVLFLVQPLAVLLINGIPVLGQLLMPVWIMAVRSVLLALGASAPCPFIGSAADDAVGRGDWNLSYRCITAGSWNREIPDHQAVREPM